MESEDFISLKSSSSTSQSQRQKDKAKVVKESKSISYSDYTSMISSLGESKKFQIPVPWQPLPIPLVSGQEKYKPFAQFHNEIVDFLNFILPSQKEREDRSKVLYVLFF